MKAIECCSFFFGWTVLARRPSEPESINGVKSVFGSNPLKDGEVRGWFGETCRIAEGRTINFCDGHRFPSRSSGRTSCRGPRGSAVLCRVSADKRRPFLAVIFCCSSDELPRGWPNFKAILLLASTNNFIWKKTVLLQDLDSSSFKCSYWLSGDVLRPSALHLS